MNGMTECQRPNVLFVMFGSTKGGMDHHRTRGSYDVLDCVISNAIVVVVTDASVVDFLTL